MGFSRIAAIALATGMSTVWMPPAQSDSPAAAFPETLQSYEVQGVSLKTDPAAVHGILLARGFKLLPGSDKTGGSAGVRGIYERNYSLRERRGERVTYEDSMSGSQQAAGGAPVARKIQRSIWYQQLFPIGTIPETQRSWSSNPDQSWVKPLFDQACAYYERELKPVRCARENWRLTTMQTNRVGIDLRPTATSVSLTQASIVSSTQAPAGTRPPATR